MIDVFVEELNMSPDLSVYQGEEEEKEETKNSEKNSKIKVKSISLIDVLYSVLFQYYSKFDLGLTKYAVCTVLLL